MSQSNSRLDQSAQTQIITASCPSVLVSRARLMW
jgi:hypothetical protein